MIPSEAATQYNAILRLLDARGRAQLQKAIENAGTDKKAIVRALEGFSRAYGDAAARTSAMVYDSIAELEGFPADAEPEPQERAEATRKAGYSILSDLTQDNIESKRGQILDRFSYEVRRAAGDSMLSFGNGDVLFARVPTGAETCPFCIMLASRGFVYGSSESAGELEHYHANCDCVIVPSTSGEVAGYDPDRYYAEYRKMMDEGKISYHAQKYSGGNKPKQAATPRAPKSALYTDQWVEYVQGAQTPEEVEARFDKYAAKAYKAKVNTTELSRVQKAAQERHKELS